MQRFKTMFRQRPVMSTWPRHSFKDRNFFRDWDKVVKETRKGIVATKETIKRFVVTRRDQGKVRRSARLWKVTRERQWETRAHPRRKVSFPRLASYPVSRWFFHRFRDFVACHDFPLLSVAEHRPVVRHCSAVFGGLFDARYTRYSPTLPVKRLHAHEADELCRSRPDGACTQLPFLNRSKTAPPSARLGSFNAVLSQFAACTDSQRLLPTRTRVSRHKSFFFALLYCY